MADLTEAQLRYLIEHHTNLAEYDEAEAQGTFAVGSPDEYRASASAHRTMVDRLKAELADARTLAAAGLAGVPAILTYAVWFDTVTGEAMRRQLDHREHMVLACALSAFFQGVIRVEIGLVCDALGASVEVGASLAQDVMRLERERDAASGRALEAEDRASRAEESARRGWEQADSLHVSVKEQRERAEKAEAERDAALRDNAALRAMTPSDHMTQAVLLGLMGVIDPAAGIALFEEWISRFDAHEDARLSPPLYTEQDAPIDRARDGAVRCEECDENGMRHWRDRDAPCFVCNGTKRKGGDHG